MTIYKCDRCGKELTSGELRRISAESEKLVYDESVGLNCWGTHRRSGFHDVCEECAKEVMLNFLDDLRKFK